MFLLGSIASLCRGSRLVDDFQAKIKTTCASDSDLAEVQDYTQRVQRAIELQAQKQSQL